MKIKFWKKEPEPEPEKKKYVYLTIVFKNSQKYEVCRTYKADSTVTWLQSFKEFYLWYLTRPQSERYAMEHSHGADIIERGAISNISFRVEVK
jgi:hypothetical protein